MIFGICVITLMCVIELENLNRQIITKEKYGIEFSMLG